MLVPSIRCRLIVCLALLCARGSSAQTPAAAPAPAAVAPPSVLEIVGKAVARDGVRRQRRLAFECHQTIRTERLDASGKVTSSKVVRMIFHPTLQIAYSTNVDATSESATRDQDSAKAQRVMAIMDLGKLAPHFVETLAGSCLIQNRDCYIISYQPKPGQTADSRDEKVVNNLAGRFWIAKDNFDILQSDGALVGPVTVALIASVTRMDFHFRSQPLPNGDVGPASFSVDLAVHAPFYDFRQLQVNTLENWCACRN